MTAERGGFFIRSKRVPPVLIQTEISECGLVCVAMISHYFGNHISLRALRARYGVSTRGTRLAELIEVATGLGLRSRLLRVELEELSELRLPCVLHWDMSHFVVLVETTGSNAVVHDPTRGRRVITLAEMDASFTGVALELEPTASFKKQHPEPSVPLRALVGQVRGLPRALTSILAVSIALQCFLLIGPFFMQWTLDHVLVYQDLALMSVLAAAFIFILALQSAIAFTRGWAIARLSASINVQWTTNVFSHIVRLPLAYFEKRHLGDIVSRIASVSSIQKTVSTTSVETIIDGAMAAATLVVMTTYSGRLALISLAALSLYLTLRLVSFRTLRSLTETKLVAAAKQSSHSMETIRGVQSIRLATKESVRISEQQALASDAVNADLRLTFAQQCFATGSQITFGIERIIVVWVGAHLVVGGAFSIGMLVAYLAYREMFASRVSSLVEQVVEFMMLRLHSERLADIVLQPPESQLDPLNFERCIESSSLELVDVWFRYADNEPWLLKGCSAKFSPNESVAIIGPSGCGKTTLIKIMLGLLTPSRGQLMVDGRPLNEVGIRNYRKVCGSVMQEDQLFARSVSENVALLEQDVDEARVIRACQLASVHEDIAAMPLGYATQIGDMGLALSGGQKQRLVLARALYREPKILFLDEATSHLDVARESKVNAAIGQLAITRIIVAHRTETIASAERVLRLEGGVLIEQRAKSAHTEAELS